MARRQKFEDHFWSDHNQGFEVLLQGMKSQISASKELMDFIKERASVEDAHTRSINKLHKQMGHSSDTSVGTFFPVWTVSVEMLNKLADANNTFVRNLLDLSKEVGEYHQSQKDKMKSNMKGEIEAAKEAYHMLEVAEMAVHKAKKAYEAAHHEHTALQYELTNAQNLGITAKIEKIDAKVKKAEATMIHAKQEYTTAVDNHVKQMMEYQGKHKEACAKFESIEEEHLAQMVTFTIQLASALEANINNVDKVQKDTVRKVSDLSVDKLIAFYIQTKGTGRDIPRPEKVRLVKDSSPSPSNTSAASQSNVSTTSTSTSTSENTTQKAHTAKEKGLKKLFKRGKQTAVDASATTNGPTASQPDTEQPEVDEEGYSIRPQDADRITGFDDITVDSDSDLDDDSDTTNKLKSIHIREASNPVSTATVDEIKASLKGLQLPSPHSPILSKAGSLNALNKLNVTDKSPPSSRRAYLSPSESIPASSSLGSNKPMALSLLDLDSKNVDIQLNTPPGMPPPLIPSVDLFGGTNVTTTTTADQLPGSGSDKKLSKGETTDFADFSANFGDNSSRSPWGDSDTPTGKKTSTPLATTPVTSIIEISTPPTVLAKSSESNVKPSSSNIPPPSASPILPKPPQGNRRRVNKAGSTSSQSSSFTASFEAESTTVNSTTTTTTTTTTAAAATTTITVTTPPTQESDDNLPVPTKRRATTSSDATISQGNYENTPPVSTSVSFPLDKTADDSAPKKPVPVPRRNTIDRNLMASSPLALTSIRSPNTSTISLPSIDVKEENTGVKVQQQQQQQQPHKESSSALSSSSSLSTIGSVGSALQSKESTSNNSVVIPIALAIQETVNASFKGKTGITKVTGEVDMSFATSFLQQLSSHDALVFRLSNIDNVERLQHNRNLVTLNDDGSYKFNMTALCSFLNDEAAKSPTPSKFYNVQVFRYEVVLVNGIDDLPLRLRCFWKCDPMVTNYRIDYKYNEVAVKGIPLTALAICVSVDGVVSRHLCKPEGKWSQEQQKLMWQFPKAVAEPQSLQAKFELSEGPSHPSPTLVQFNCEGASLSGMQLDLVGQAYRISFKKNKLSSGKYLAMPAE